jgi:organic radical activating enzyme
MSCDGCVTISNIPREGVQPLQDVLDTIEQWGDVLDPQWVVLFGGEPLLHPHIKEILLAVRQKWPNAGISLPTNALLLRKIIDQDFITQLGKFELRVSLHKNDNDGKFFKSLMTEYMNMFKGWTINNRPFNEYGTPPSEQIPHKFNFQHPNGLSVAVSQNEDFIIPYQYDIAGNIRPYNNDPAQAWSNCVSAELVYLYKKQLWKCLPYPNLKDAVPEFDSLWPKYKPFNASDDLTPFFANISNHEDLCSMCPTANDKRLNHGDPSVVRILPNEKWLQRNTR